MLGTMLLSGCKSEKVQEVVDDTEQTVSVISEKEFEADYTSLKIAKKDIKIPVSYAEIADLGFTDSLDPAIKIFKGKPVKIEFTDASNNHLSGYIAYTGENEYGYKADSQIIAVLVSRDTAANLDISFCEGINFESSEEDASNVLEQLGKTEDNSLYGIKISNYKYFSVSFKDNAVHDIMIVNSDEAF